MIKGAIRNAASKKNVSSTTVNTFGCYSFYAAPSAVVSSAYSNATKSRSRSVTPAATAVYNAMYGGSIAERHGCGVILSLPTGS